eukprot:gene1846-1125_t
MLLNVPGAIFLFYFYFIIHYIHSPRPFSVLNADRCCRPGFFGMTGPEQQSRRPGGDGPSPGCGGRCPVRPAPRCSPPPPPTDTHRTSCPPAPGCGAALQLLLSRSLSQYIHIYLSPVTAQSAMMTKMHPPPPFPPNVGWSADGVASHSRGLWLCATRFPLCVACVCRRRLLGKQRADAALHWPVGTPLQGVFALLARMDRRESRPLHSVPSASALLLHLLAPPSSLSFLPTTLTRVPFFAIQATLSPSPLSPPPSLDLMAPRKIILDCDPGIDDALALLLAHSSPDIELLAVTTVAGNQVLEKVTRNALALGELASRRRSTATPGWGDVKLPAPTRIQLDERHAVQVIIDIVMQNEPKTVTIVPTGALTNIALAVKMEPRIVDRVKEVVLMGGAYHTGNSTPVTEFNIDTDPEAAHIVFSQSWKVTMVGLDLTHQAEATDAVQKQIAAVGTNISKIVLRLIEFYTTMYQKEAKMPWCVVHDVCAVAYVINPDLLKTVRCPIHVELHGQHTYGMTVADLRPKSADVECNTYVATQLDFDGFWNLFVDGLKRLGDPKW